VEHLLGLDRPPRVLVAASAIGFYGDRGDEVVDETSVPGTGFLADVCRAWEEAAAPAREAGIRVVFMRFGTVLSPKGGALAKMLPVFRLGAGGRIGHGRQHVSWIGIVFLDRDLETSSGVFRHLFAMFARGRAVVPAAGMGAIPRQLAASLPEGSVRCGASVARVDAAGVSLSGGERIDARAVVVATEAPAASTLLGLPKPPRGRSVTCLYFAADSAPVDEPVVVLDGDGTGPVNDLAVMSAVAPTYAPAGAALVDASVPRTTSAGEEAAVVGAARAQLAGWFGSGAHAWRHLRTYRIDFALPDQTPASLRTRRPERLLPGLYVL